MQFLSDIFIRCPDCNGRRYRPHILEITIPVLAPHGANGNGTARRRKTEENASREWNIADVLDATAHDVAHALQPYRTIRAGARAIRSINLLEEVGLGYLRLGQPINTLSGGESQRLKLVSEIAAFANTAEETTKPTLFVFDEPTTGLHFEDIRILLAAFQRLVDKGHSLLVIEHNLDVIKCADWVIDLGPEAGANGGCLVVEGTPETVAACRTSHTATALRDARVLNR